MSITKSLARAGRVVAYYPNIARALDGDIPATIILCQFIYWRGRAGDREIYKTRDEIEHETAVKHDAQRRVFSKLSKLGFVRLERKGIPAKTYYLWDWQAVDLFLENSIEDYSTSRGGESPDQCAGNPKISAPGIPASNTETTTEITTERRIVSRAGATTPAEASPGEAPKPVKARLPEEWTPSDEDREYAISMKLTDDDIREIADDFHAYWTDRTDAGGRKSARGWRQTWRNRIRDVAPKFIRNRQMAFGSSAGGYGRGSSLASIVARRELERRG